MGCHALGRVFGGWCQWKTNKDIRSLFGVGAMPGHFCKEHQYLDPPRGAF